MGSNFINRESRVTEWSNSDTQELLNSEVYGHAGSPVATENMDGLSQYMEPVTKMKELLEKQFPGNHASFFIHEN